jgi:electron transfer flavoprotein beta subunit
VVLLSDRRFAGADTLATSYTLKYAIEKLGQVDLVFCGRQAIDGDTAQVGPQTAEKLGIPQITYADAIVSLEGNEIVATRAFPLGKEWVKCSLPCLLTVVGTANRPRPASIRKKIENKLAATPSEQKTLLGRWPEFETEANLDAYLTDHNLKIAVWTADDLGVEADRLGLNGSPTQVYKVNFVVLETLESKEIPANAQGIAALMQELVKEYIVG